MNDLLKRGNGAVFVLFLLLALPFSMGAIWPCKECPVKDGKIAELEEQAEATLKKKNETIETAKTRIADLKTENAKLKAENDSSNMTLREAVDKIATQAGDLKIAQIINERLTKDHETAVNNHESVMKNMEAKIETIAKDKDALNRYLFSAVLAAIALLFIGIWLGTRTVKAFKEQTDQTN